VSGRTRKESIESRGSTSWNDGLHPFDGGSGNDGGGAEAQVPGTGSGEPRRGGNDAVGNAAWFDPVEDLQECPGGVCPVPWAANTEKIADQVNHPAHYIENGGIECIEAIESQLTKEEYQGYLRGNCVKYLWRWKNKGGVQDLKKCKWYLDRLIGTEENQKG
jgi:hypothetical protein